MTDNPKKPPKADEPKGIEYAPRVAGKGTFRVRTRYVADALAPMITSRQVDAAKLDLVLRGIALLPDDAGAREPGLVLPRVSREMLHDLCRDPRTFAIDSPTQYLPDIEDRAKKSEWARVQLKRLEQRKLLRRVPQDDQSSRIVVLRDDGSGEDFDDPRGHGEDDYVTLFGSVISSPEFREWGGAEVMAYICSMLAGRYATKGSGESPSTATWSNSTEWFTDKWTDRPAGHVLFPISHRTIQRGLRTLRDQGWIDIELTTHVPWGRTTKPRCVYTNRFDRLEDVAEVVNLENERRRRTG